MSNNSNNPYSANTWDFKNGPVTANPWAKTSQPWKPDAESTNVAPPTYSVKTGGAEGHITAASTDDAAVADFSGTAAVAQLRGSYENKLGGVWGTVNYDSVSASGHAGVTAYGEGAQGSASAVGLQGQVVGELGNAHTGGIGGYLDGKAGYVGVKGQALLGDDGRYQGVALGGSAQASALDGTAGANVTYPIDWIPFVPKGWTINLKGEAEGMVGDVHISGGGYLYRDRADNRGHFGLFAGLGLGLGAFAGIDFSIGAGMTAEQQKSAAAEAAKEAAAAAKAAAADLIRPIARMTDPLGAHGSSHFWAYLAMALVAVVAVAACIVCPALLLGAATWGAASLAGAAVATLTTVSLATGAMQVAGSIVDSFTRTESGSSCSEIKKGSTKTKIEGQWVARIEDPNSHGAGKLKTGAEKVWEGGHPVSRVKESSTCGAAKVLKGANRTFAGGNSVSSGAPDEATSEAGGDALFNRIQGTLGTISLVTGLIGGGIGALRAGFAAAGRQLGMAAFKAGAKATAKDVVKQAAIMTTAHYAAPVVSAGLQKAGVSKEVADASVNGVMLGTMATAHAMSSRGMTTAAEAPVVEAVRGKANEPTVLTDDVAGNAMATRPAETVTAPDNVAAPVRTAANDNVAPQATRTAAEPTVEPVAAEPAAPAPIKPDELQYHSELSINDAVKGADRATLEAATKDPTVAQQLAEQGGTTQARVQRDAAIVLSRDNAGELKAGDVRSSEDFNYEAEVSGHKVETMDEVFRLDQRSPEQIAQEGFAPNPNKEAGTLMEHVAEQVSGSGNYVSTSSDAAHAGTLLNPDFFPSTPIKGADPLSIESGATRQTPQDLEYLVREYKISDVDGVKLRDGVGVAAEKEVVIRGANPDQIQYRDITIKQRWQELDGSDADGPWFSYQLTSVRKISTEDVNIGEWQSLPKVENAAKPISDPPAARRAATVEDGATAQKPIQEASPGKVSANDGPAAGGGAATPAAPPPECTTCSGTTAAKTDAAAAVDTAPSADGSAWRAPADGPPPTSTTTDVGNMKPLFKPLFAEGGPKMTDVAQGALGDCYLMTALGAVAKTNPSLLERMIVDNGDGTSTVTFENGARTAFDSEGNAATIPGTKTPVTVSNKVPTDATPVPKPPASFLNRIVNRFNGRDPALDDPYYGTANKYAKEKDASWVAVVEKAYAEEYGGGKGYEGIDGGHSHEVWKKLGYPDASYKSISGLSSDEVFKMVDSSLADGDAVAATSSAHTEADRPPGGHAYVVEGTGTTADGSRVINLFNPWNSTGEYGGKFQIYDGDFVDWFHGLRIGVPPK